MRISHRLGYVLSVSVFISWATTLHIHAAEINPAPPRITADKTTNGLPRLIFPYPAAQSYQMYSTDNVTNAYTLDTTREYFWARPGS